MLFSIRFEAQGRVCWLSTDSYHAAVHTATALSRDPAIREAQVCNGGTVPHSRYVNGELRTFRNLTVGGA